MRFPTTISFRVTTKAEYDEFVQGLRGWVEHLRKTNEDATIFAAIIQSVRYNDDKGVMADMPEAYVETSGRRVGAGDSITMRNLFQQEIAGHRAKVILYERDQDGLGYKATLTRGAATK